ncbi:unnamed protein product [Closterium sp. NIES-53]
MLGEGEQMIFMVVYVDDILIFSPSSDLVKEAMLKLQDKFKCKALGDLSFYLELNIERDVEKRCMRVHQRKYLKTLAANFGQSEGHVATPFPSGFKCVKGPEEESVGEEERRGFHSLVGSLMYAAVNTQPDVTFATRQLARAVQCPNVEQVVAGMRVAKYLGQTLTVGLQYSAAAKRRQKGADGVEPGHLFLTAFSDASYALEPEDMTSVGEFICCVGGDPTRTDSSVPYGRLCGSGVCWLNWGRSSKDLPHSTATAKSGLGFESRCMHVLAVAVVHFGHPSAGGCQRSNGDPRLILEKGYRLVVLGGYGSTDPLLNKPFYPSGLVTGILTWYQSGLRFESRCMHMLAVAVVPSPGPPSMGGCQKTCNVSSPIDSWRVTGLFAWGVMGALTRY